MFIIMKRILLLCGCLILVGGVVFYFYQQNKPAPEPVKIYNAPKSVPKQESAAKTPSGKSLEDAHVEHDHPQHSDTAPEISAPAVTGSPSPEKKGDVLSEEAIQRWVTEIMAELEQVNTRLMEKYPELLEIGTLTKEEFFQKYSTPELQNALLERLQLLKPAVFAELHAVYSNIPIEIVDDILLVTKDHFVKLWGQDTADQVMRQLRTELGL